MKVLVTGGLGFIGSHIVDALVDKCEVFVIDNLSTGTMQNRNLKAQLIIADLSVPESLEEMPDVDVVYHCAALPRIQPSIKDPAPHHDSNVNATLNILEYCRRSGAKLVFSSSSSLYTGEYTPTKENAPKQAKNPYSLQKMICEQYIELYSQLYELNYVILRYFNVYGERQLTGGAYATVIGIFLAQHKEGKPLTITGDGEQRRDFTYVGDVVKANLLAGAFWTGIYNIGAGKNYSINEIAAMFGGEKEYLPARPGEVRQTLADNYRAGSVGWKPETKVEDWVKNHA